MAQKMKIYMPCGHITCKDGTTLSVQAGRSLYCEPREDGLDNYDTVEVGFPSKFPPDSWAQYADSCDSHTPDIYAFVPTALVEEYIALHGGIDIGRTIAAMRKASVVEF